MCNGRHIANFLCGTAVQYGIEAGGAIVRGTIELTAITGPTAGLTRGNGQAKTIVAIVGTKVTLTLQAGGTIGRTTSSGIADQIGTGLSVFVPAAGVRYRLGFGVCGVLQDIAGTGREHGRRAGLTGGLNPAIGLVLGLLLLKGTDAFGCGRKDSLPIQRVTGQREIVTISLTQTNGPGTTSRHAFHTTAALGTATGQILSMNHRQ